MTTKEFVLDTMMEAGRMRAEAFRSRTINDALDGTTVIANESIIPQWRQGPYAQDTVGAPVRCGGQVYKVWQAHDSTQQPDWTPELAVSLFDIFHTTDPSRAKPWMQASGTRGMYMTGEVCLWTDGLTYRSTMDNNIWSPEAYAGGWEAI